MRKKLSDQLQRARVPRPFSKLRLDQQGNVMIMVAAALIPLLGLVGSGVDISRAYMAQLRLQQACDAGVLAGRRTMAAAQWTGTPQELGTPNGEAHRMFNFNYPDSFYGSREVNFSAAAISTSNVVGTATAFLPTVFMHMFPYGKEGFDLSVSCTAEMEIANTDVMLVFDVTGSMLFNVHNDKTASAGNSRLDSLKQAAIDFFDTITAATRTGDGRLRIGMVPYNSMANVGYLLLAKDKNWVSDHALISSRSPQNFYYWSSSDDRTAIKNQPAPVRENWENILIESGATSSNCSNWPKPVTSFASNSNTVSSNIAGLSQSRSGSDFSKGSTEKESQINSSGKVHKFYEYQYSFTNGACYLQRRLATVTLSRSIAAPNKSQFNGYLYANRVLDVTGIKSAFSSTRDTSTGAETYQNPGRITVNSGASGASTANIPWTGCVVERRTKPVSSGAPTGTLDLDIDTIPTDIASRWMMMFPNDTYSRTATIGGTTNSLSPSATTSEYAKFGHTATGGEGNSAWGNCPTPAKKLTTMTQTSRATFEGWLNELNPVGGTYHDAGLVWGLRLLSEHGLFGDENRAAPNSRPIGRHIIFMTDGNMDARAGILSHQGYEVVDRRVSGASQTDDDTMKKLHRARFSQLCEKAVEKNITIWVVVLSTSPDAEVRNCATADKVYVASTRAELISAFNSIAGQISRLRLAQ